MPDRPPVGARRCIDLDHFKQVNDTLGHRAGDEVLKETARRLSAPVRPDDAVVRLGGDEFLLVMADALDDERAAAIGRTLVDSLRQPIATDAGVATVSASVGIASARRGEADEDFLDLIADADGALLAAKRAGRGRLRSSSRDTTPPDGFGSGSSGG